MPKKRKFSVEEIKFVKSNFNGNYNETKKKYMDHFNTTIDKRTFNDFVRSLGVENTLHFFSKANIEWLSLRVSSKEDITDEIVNEYNKEFNDNRNKQSLYQVCYRNKICGEKRTNAIFYTKEEKKWIIDNFSKYDYERYYDYDTFSSDFKNEFGKTITKAQLNNFQRRHNYLKMQNNHYVLSEKLYEANHLRGLPLLSEICSNNLIYIKVKNDINPRHKQMKNFMLKKRYMYEKYHNCKLKDDELIIQLDNDYKNFDKDNLIKVSAKVLGKMNGKLYSQIGNLKLKKMAINICELEAIMEGEE